MRNILTLVLAPLALLVAASCGGGSPQEQAMDKMEEITETIEGIDSADDVEPAKAKIKSLVEEINALKADAGGDDAEELDEAQKERGEALMKRMMAAAPGLVQIEGGASVMELMKGLE